MLEKLRQIFASIDVNNDGRLSNTEIAAKLNTDDELEELMLKAGKSHAEVAKKLDLDADGFVTLEEMLEILGAQGTTFTIEWLEEQINFHQEDIKSRRLNVLSIESGVDAGTLEEDAEKCNAEWNEEYGKYQRDLGEVFPVWALMFSVVEDDDGNITNLITHEAVEVIQKMWELDLAVDIRRTIDLAEIIVLVGTRSGKGAWGWGICLQESSGGST